VKGESDKLPVGYASLLIEIRERVRSASMLP